MECVNVFDSSVDDSKYPQVLKERLSELASRSESRERL